VNYSGNYNVSGANHRLLRGVEFEIISTGTSFAKFDLRSDSIMQVNFIFQR
jgi:hypothetical protein